jgi:hypothetical protein
MIYFVCAKEFGWTPEITDNVPVKLLFDLLSFLEEVKDREYEMSKNG